MLTNIHRPVFDSNQENESRYPPAKISPNALAPQINKEPPTIPMAATLTKTTPTTFPTRTAFKILIFYLLVVSVDIIGMAQTGHDPYQEIFF